MASAMIISRRTTMTTMKRLLINIYNNNNNNNNRSLLIKEWNRSISTSLINTLSPPPTNFCTDNQATSQFFSHHHHWRSFCTRSSAPATPTISQEVKDTSKSSSQGKEGGGSGGNGDNGDNSEQQKQQGKSVRGGPVSWLSFLLLVATGAGLVFYYDREKKKHIQDINTASTAVKQGPSAGKAAIGGPFSLLDHNGKSVTEKDFKGKWTVVYFGFTHCPDICPDELQKLAAAVDNIKKKSGIDIIPIFISVDPERDNVEQVHEYVKEFHPALIGLTGTSDEIKKVARAFRVYYMKTEEEGTDYLVDHSIVMYLMDPNMEFVKFYGKNNDVDSLTDGIINEIKLYKKTKA